MKTKKIRNLLLCIIVSAISISAVGCGKKNDKASDLFLDSSKDKSVKIGIITEQESEDYSAYNVAEAEKKQFEYKKDNNGDFKGEIKHYVLPYNYRSKEEDTKKLFDTIEKDKSINVVIVTSKKGGLNKYVKNLKSRRNDVLTISSTLNEPSKELVNIFDLNFGVEDLNRGERIVQLAKSFGAEKMFCFATDEDLRKEPNKKIYNGFLSESKKDDLPVILEKIPSNLDKYEKKAYVSNKIDDIIKEYGQDINIYTFDKDLDEVLASKVLKEKFFIIEFSSRNINDMLLSLYGIKEIGRQKYNYVFENSEIGSLVNARYNLIRRISSSGGEPSIFSLEFSTELGYVLKAKDLPVSKAYNSYFLEKVSFSRLGIESGFINKYKGIGNYKIVDPDQIIY